MQCAQDHSGRSLLVMICETIRCHRLSSHLKMAYYLLLLLQMWMKNQKRTERPEKGISISHNRIWERYGFGCRRRRRMRRRKRIERRIKLNTMSNCRNIYSSERDIFAWNSRVSLLFVGFIEFIRYSDIYRQPSNFTLQYMVEYGWTNIICQWIRLPEQTILALQLI